jgi:hypothetical protein
VETENYKFMNSVDLFRDKYGVVTK